MNAIFSSTLVVWLTPVPSDVVFEHFRALTSAPGPTSSAILLGPCRPIVEVAFPGAIFGKVAQTIEFTDTFYEERLHPQTATRLPDFKFQLLLCKVDLVTFQPVYFQRGKFHHIFLSTHQISSALQLLNF
jgi:hypothetical protein